MPDTIRNIIGLPYSLGYCVGFCKEGAIYKTTLNFKLFCENFIFLRLSVEEKCYFLDQHAIPKICKISKNCRHAYFTRDLKKSGNFWMKFSPLFFEILFQSIIFIVSISQIIFQRYLNSPLFQKLLHPFMRISTWNIDFPHVFQFIRPSALMLSE